MPPSPPSGTRPPISPPQVRGLEELRKQYTPAAPASSPPSSPAARPAHAQEGAKNPQTKAQTASPAPSTVQVGSKAPNAPSLEDQDAADLSAREEARTSVFQAVHPSVQAAASPSLPLVEDPDPWENGSSRMRSQIEEAVRALPNNQIRLEDLLLGRARQIVPIVPGLRITFQSMKSREDLLIRELMQQSASSLEMYFDLRFDLLGLAVAVHAINDVVLEPPLEENGRTTKEALLKRFEHLSDLPATLIRSIAVNKLWFDLRVQAASAPSRLKNGS